MATTPTTPFQSLPLAQQVNLVENAYLSYYGVSLPVTTVLAKDKLPAIAAEVTQELNGIKALYSMTGNDRTATVQGLDAFVKYVPELAGATITVGTLLDVFTGVQSNLNSLVKNPLVVPPVTPPVVVPPVTSPVVVPPVVVPPTPVVPPPTPKPVVVPPVVVPPTPVVPPPTPKPVVTAAPVASSQSNNTLSTVLGVGAAALGAIALVKAFTPQAAPAAVPAAAVAELTREANRGASGLTVAKAETAGAPTQQDTRVYPSDWRVRLSLAPSANYLYKSVSPPGILLPLVETNGVIFPYTPNIQVSYAAHYDPAELTHSNYKIFQYKNSSVDNITITCDFTAQDTAEANYLLAVIHFFRSVTKMFYGQDGNPMRGTPPPLCYLTGLGQFQFDQHPLAITNFNYTLPIDVDYVRASSTGTTVAGGTTPSGGADPYPDAQSRRMAAAAVQPAAAPKPPSFNFTAATNTQATYVPTKMQISITAVPIVSRGDISKEFSLKEYATGALLQGSKRPGGGGGIW